jgi:hypothetical protein
MKIIWGLLLVILLLLLTGCSTTITNKLDYSEQFNNSNEVCGRIDIIAYKTASESRALSSYACCQNNSCFKFALFTDKFTSITYPQFRDGLNYYGLRKQIQVGTFAIPEFAPSINGACELYGHQVYAEQGANAAADGIETASTIYKSEKLLEAAKLVRVARIANLVEPIGWADLGGAVACDIKNNKIKTAVEDTQECERQILQAYYQYGEENGVDKIKQCLQSSESELKSITESFAQIIADGIDKTFAFFKNIFSNKKNPFEVGSSSYDEINDMYKAIKGKSDLVVDQNTIVEFNTFLTRLNEKKVEYNVTMLQNQLDYDIISNKVVPFSTQVWHWLLFKKVGNSSRFDDLDVAYTQNKRQCEDYRDMLYMNYAITCQKELSTKIEALQTEKEVELNQKYTFDLTSPLMIVLIIVLLFLGVKKFILHKDD